MDHEFLDIVQNLMDQPSSQNLTTMGELLQNQYSGTSVLYNVVDSTLSKAEKLRIVRFMIEAGADCDERDRQSGLTASEFALERLGDRELALEMIRAEVISLPVDRAFYVLIRRGSLEVFKLFLEVKQFREEEIFQNVANAMIELNTKRVVIDEDREVFLQFLLANYAQRNLCGDVKIDKDVNEWRLHFEVIEDNWKVLKRDYCDHNFANVDNIFLHRIQTIHNHLFFVKDKRFLKHLPMMEATFCVALLVSNFNDRFSTRRQSIVETISQYINVQDSNPSARLRVMSGMFKFFINKVNIMQFLDVICRQLTHIKMEIDRFGQQMKTMLDSVSSESIPSKEHLMDKWKEIVPGKNLGENIANKIISGLRKKCDSQVIVDEIIANESLDLPIKINCRDRSTLRKLKRCYFRTRQLYSILKCHSHISSISSYASRTPSDLITVPAVKRLIQVIGEAIKTTKNSPNMPKKVESVLNQMLTPLFPEFNKLLREFFSHRYSLAKLLLSDTEERICFEEFPNYIGYAEMVFSFALVQALAEASQTLLGFMRRCRTVDQLATLFQYVSDLRIVEKVQKESFEKVGEMLRKIEQSFKSAEVLTETERSNLIYLKKVVQDQKVIVERLEVCLISKWGFDFDSIKTACHGKAPLCTIHRMIEYNLTFGGPSEIYNDVKNRWKHSFVNVRVLIDKDLLKASPSIMIRMLGILQNKLTDIEDVKYMETTEAILEEFDLEKLPDEAVNQLHKQLLKYYENIFSLDKKYQTLKQFFKSRKLQLDEQRFKLMRKKDEEELQCIFNRQLEDMRRILQAYRISTVDDLATNISRTPNSVLMALEHCQLELCEILITVGYYGDNFHLMKHRIPLIHGRNFRNYLAHDQSSYNVLTDCSKRMVLINAVAMVNCPIKLIGRQSVDSGFGFEFPTLKSTLEWITGQQLLMKSIQEMNHADIQKSVDQGADLHGTFCQTISPMMPLHTSSPSLNFVDLDSSADVLSQVLKIFQTKFPHQCRKFLYPSYRLWYAAHKGDFEQSFQIYAANQQVSISTLPEPFVYWKDLITHLQRHSVDFDEVDSHGSSLLHKLAEAGNYSAVVELLALKPDLDVNVLDKAGHRPLNYALKYGHRDLAEVLFTAAPSFTAENQQYAVMNHLNDLVPGLFVVVSSTALANKEYVVSAVRANNLIALEFIVDNLYNDDYVSLKAKHLQLSLALGAYLNHMRIVEYLLSLPDVDYFSAETSDLDLPSGNRALQYAIRRRNWRIVELLLRNGASSHWVHPDEQETAFHLAVRANNLRVVRLMWNTERNKKLYQQLPFHPLAIVVQNDSLKMAKYLEEVGFSILDSNWVLRNAIRYKKEEFVKRVFQTLDDLVEEWKSEEGSLVGIVGNLLSRWKVIAYLEELEFNSQTVLMEAIAAQDWSVVDILLDTCKKRRHFGGRYITGIQVYCRQKLVYSNDQAAAPEYKELCEDLLQNLKLVSSSDSTQLNAELIDGRKMDVVLLSANSSIEDFALSIKSVEDLPQYLATLQDLLQFTNNLICGTIHDNSSSQLYFLVSSKASCLFKLSHTEQKTPLEKMVNTADGSGDTPLHLLAKYSSSSVVLELLVSNGADPLATNLDGEKPLHLFLFDFDGLKAMALLKSLNNASFLELPNSNGLRPLHLAAKRGHLQAVQFLIDQGVDLKARDKKGCNPTIHALDKPSRSVLKLLLDSDPQLMHLEDYEGLTLLHHSAESYDTGTIKLILEYSPDLLKENRKGCTAVERAAGIGNATWLKIVLKYARSNNISRLIGSNFSRLELSLFILAVLSNRREAMQIALEYEIGCELTEDLPRESVLKLRDQLTHRTALKGSTALHFAVQRSFEHSIAFILHCQALHNRLTDEKLDLARHTFNQAGHTPLQWAQEVGNKRIVDQLLKMQ